MSKVVRCYGSKRRAIVGPAAMPKLNSLVSELVADALEFGDGNVKHVHATALTWDDVLCDNIRVITSKDDHEQGVGSSLRYEGSAGASGGSSRKCSQRAKQALPVAEKTRNGEAGGNVAGTPGEKEEARLSDANTAPRVVMSPRDESESPALSPSSSSPSTTSPAQRSQLVGAPVPSLSRSAPLLTSARVTHLTCIYAAHKMSPAQQTCTTGHLVGDLCARTALVFSLRAACSCLPLPVPRSSSPERKRVRPKAQPPAGAILPQGSARGCASLHAEKAADEEKADAASTSPRRRFSKRKAQPLNADSQYRHITAPACMRRTPSIPPSMPPSSPSPRSVTSSASSVCQEAWGGARGARKTLREKPKAGRGALKEGEEGRERERERKERRERERESQAIRGMARRRKVV
jgi:hypothetical protein